MKKKFLTVLCSALLLSVSFAGLTPAIAQGAAKEPLAIFQFENGMEGLEIIQKGSSAVPEVVVDETKGNVLHISFGANAEESTASFLNPFAGKNNLTSIAMTAWVKIPNAAPYMEFDGLFGFTNDNARLTLQAKPYVCWNAGTEGGVEENWIDWKADSLAFPGFDTAIAEPSTDTWQHYAVVIEGNTIAIFVNGIAVAQSATGTGANFNTENALTMLDFLVRDDVKAYFGSGSFWGSQECFLDDVAFYDTALSASEIAERAGIKVMEYGLDTAALTYDFENGADGLTIIQKGTTLSPEIISDEVKGNALHVSFGAMAEESTAQITNPYIGKKDLSAITITAWVKVPATAPYLEFDGLLSFTNDNARLTLQTRPYVCWNAGTEGVEENWIDWKADNLAFLGFDAKLAGPSTNTWQHYAVVIEGNTITIYVNGVAVPQAATGNGTNFGTEGALTMIDFVTHKDVKAYIGSGSFWGSQECFLDDISFYTSALTSEQIVQKAGISEAGYPLGYTAPSPTEVPTSTPEPTLTPTKAPETPTNVPSDTPQNTSSSSSKISTTTVIIIVAVVIVAGGAGLVIVKKKKTK